jgi:hypothetical protein
MKILSMVGFKKQAIEFSQLVNKLKRRLKFSSNSTAFTREGKPTYSIKLPPWE